MNKQHCETKASYLDYKSAHRQMKHVIAQDKKKKRKYLQQQIRNLKVYQCEHCGFFHIGHEI